MKPKRIQRKRTKGWRMPERAVYVGRPSKWGSPFVKGHDYDAGNGWRNLVRSRAHAYLLYRDWIHAPEQAELRQAIKDELRGKDLACWCPLQDENGNPVPCHADTLLELANQEE